MNTSALQYDNTRFSM